LQANRASQAGCPRHADGLNRRRACGVPKLGARSEKWPICRQDANFDTPQEAAEGIDFVDQSDSGCWAVWAVRGSRLRRIGWMLGQALRGGPFWPGWAVAVRLLHRTSRMGRPRLRSPAHWLRPNRPDDPTARSGGHTPVATCACGTKDSPSRFCFRPHLRWIFGFRLRPVGDASSYSQPVLGAAVTVLENTPPFKASSTGSPETSAFYNLDARTAPAEQVLPEDEQRNGRGLGVPPHLGGGEYPAGECTPDSRGLPRRGTRSDAGKENLRQFRFLL
jgi:hypothetical protein